MHAAIERLQTLGKDAEVFALVVTPDGHGHVFRLIDLQVLPTAFLVGNAVVAAGDVAYLGPTSNGTLDSLRRNLSEYANDVPPVRGLGDPPPIPEYAGSDLPSPFGYARLYRNWPFHNLVAHPLSEIFRLCGFPKTGEFVHDATVPRHVKGTGHG